MGRKAVMVLQTSKATHRSNWLLAALEPEDLGYLEPHLDIVILPKGTILYEAGDPIRYTYFPHDAIVGLINVMEEGQFVEVASFGREGLFGLISAIVSREAFGRYKVQVPGTASRIAIDRMREAMRARPKVQRLVLSYSEALLAQTFQTVSCNAIHTVEARCCNWILSTRDRIEEDLLPLTHADLAELLGVQRSTVSTVLRTFQTQGLITQQRGGIIIADRAGLEEMTCECYARIRQTFARLLPVP
ncbi:helix-turn-helix domain-containing protein [Microvirga makkahensis]|uniref:Helix-turn-helix domain-containing protein n=2 Tax=Microvirga makkahensis TaxID=1128670 RepID=A0A7X3MVP3_9HYPH|nr:helix-turn-helix domain-containing protein [Microvirga makkahensis]